MRIESVTAHAFGPLVDSTLPLAPGMTVVHGPNESGKSSWHAAVYAALAGRRRGKGAPKKDERRFIDRHRPWDHPQWRVSAVVSLDDGRRVELAHDLDGKVDCRATDLDLGRDVSAEIMHEGSPDGTRWLGLDRRTFAATACVSQAELLSVLSSAESLQEHLQRAAATAGTDATAAAALAALDGFRRARVGQDRVNATKPLRLAREGVTAAEAALEAAQREHAEYLRLVEQAEERQARADEAAELARDAEARLEALEALGEAARAAEDARARADRAREHAAAVADRRDEAASLLARVRALEDGLGGRVPDDLSAQEAVARQAADALAAWDALPAPTEPGGLDGPDSAELAAAIDALPDVPDGDTEVAPSVREAHRDHDRAVAVAASHDDHRPALDEALHADTDVAAAAAAGPAAVRDLAYQLESASATATQPERERLLQEVAEARSRLEEAQRAGAPAAPRAGATRWWWMACGAAATLALVLGALQLVLPALLGVGAAAALAVGALLASRRTGAAVSTDRHDLESARRAVAEIEGRLHGLEVLGRGAAAARQELESRCHALGLPSDSRRLHDLAARADLLVDERTALRRWTDEQGRRRGEVDSTAERLRAALTARGQECPRGADVLDALAAYEQTCARRAATAAQAGRRAELERALEARRRDEAALEQLRARRDTAAHRLREVTAVADATVPPGADAEEVAQRLRAWLEGWDVRHEQARADGESWSRLQALLDGRTVGEVEELHERLRREADEAGGAADTALRAAEAGALRREELCEPAQVPVEEAADPEGLAKHVRAVREDVAAYRSEAARLVHEAATARTVLSERARAMPPVAEAEEAAAAARAELDRVTGLARTLDLTTEYLQRAQERVHRDIAPQLAETLRSWLPEVTHGRYVDATVDPATLQVRVCGPDRLWRQADRLSVGTAEQVYLLLRVALTERLATTGETSPLLLDDVTVQADDGRTLELLELLLRLSQERQVVLFSQEPVVVGWAQERLASSERGAVVALTPVSAP